MFIVNSTKGFGESVNWCDYSHASGDGGGLEPADLTHPADIAFDLGAVHRERVGLVLDTPGEVQAQVRGAVDAGGSGEPGEVGR